MKLNVFDLFDHHHHSDDDQIEFHILTAFYLKFYIFTFIGEMYIFGP